MTINEIIAKLNARSDRSAWDKGVTLYAIEILESLDKLPENKEDMLNGASNWSEYSWGGCSLIYDNDIAERLCTPSELKKKRGGELQPNSREAWLDVQARALYQAANRIINTMRSMA